MWGSKPLFSSFIFLVVLGCLFLFSSCTVQEPYTKDGKEYGVTKGTFRGRWWSYYERGSSFLAGEFYTEAERDFLQALQGRSRDTWNARTYGLHFVEYFPNRELGVTYYHMGRLDDAETYLNASLSQVDTERARRYLDLVKQKRIALGQLTDVKPPDVLAKSGDNIVIGTREVSVELEASDDIGLDAITVDGKPLRFRGNAVEGRFKYATLLEEGVYTLQLGASDLAGKTSQTPVNIAVDLTGPCIAIEEPTLPLVTEAGSVQLRGAVRDESGVESVLLDGSSLSLSRNGDRLSFERELPLNAGENVFVITARDRAGNETAAAVEIYRGSPSSIRSRLWHFEQQTGTQLELASASLSVVRDILATAEQESPKPISIFVKYPKSSTEQYRKSELRVAGRVDAQMGVKTFAIRGKTYPIIEGAKRIEFSRRVPISPGENPIQIAAEDQQGYRDEWEAVVRGEPVFLDEYKMKTAVQYFKGAESGEADFLRMTLEGLLQGRQRFEVVTRTELDQILQELQLGTSELADPNFALKLGRIKPADLMIYSLVYPRADGGAELLFQAIGVETATILAQYDTFVRDTKNTEEEKRALADVADWLEEAFPRISGELIAVAGKNSWVNLGEEDGIRKGMNVVLAYEVQSAEKDATTGEILREPIFDALGWAPVVGVEKDRSKLDAVRFVEGHEGQQPTQGQPAFTM
ncbi:MAG TPA: CsgG/HfaB family protein [Candidatus Hydrogenedentes bacterium]|nr:CsgG/HfaB family protein [Candidatus Hydrogenedentota bacterium]HOL76160.1 CsgG/HfaB family protein [Candidatus Hydrogenedentota bacterium]